MLRQQLDDPVFRFAEDVLAVGVLWTRHGEDDGVDTVRVEPAHEVFRFVGEQVFKRVTADERVELRNPHRPQGLRKQDGEVARV